VNSRCAQKHVARQPVYQAVILYLLDLLTSARPILFMEVYFEPRCSSSQYSKEMIVQERTLTSPDYGRGVIVQYMH
jgi:hypothetical protein